MMHEKLRAATHDHVRGRWQPRVEREWDDAWLNLSQCLDMAAARAHHERLYEVEDTLLRFNALLLRATAWRLDLYPSAEMVHIRCCSPSWSRGSWRDYEQHVKGYHSIHFDAARQDCKHLAECLEGHDELRNEHVCLQSVMTQLEVTKICMQYGEPAEDECWADFCVPAATLDNWHQLLLQHFGQDADQKAQSLRWALWWTAARCEDKDSLLCLRLLRLIGSCFLPREAIRVLPGDHLIIPVCVPEWCEEWSAVQMSPGRYLETVSNGESVLLKLLPDLTACCRSREVTWTEQALSLLGGTIEILQHVCKG